MCSSNKGFAASQRAYDAQEHPDYYAIDRDVGLQSVTVFNTMEEVQRSGLPFCHDDFQASVRGGDFALLNNFAKGDSRE